MQIIIVTYDWGVEQTVDCYTFIIRELVEHAKYEKICKIVIKSFYIYT